MFHCFNSCNMLSYTNQQSQTPDLYTVSVLRQEEGYTAKYGPSLRDFPRAQLTPYFTVYPDLSPNTDIIPFLTMIY